MVEKWFKIGRFYLAKIFVLDMVAPRNAYISSECVLMRVVGTCLDENRFVAALISLRKAVS